MADQYEAVLSDAEIDAVFKQARPNALALGGCDYKYGRAIERATIESFRAKHLPELNERRCYDIQRDELMAANQRCARLEAEVAELSKDGARMDMLEIMAENGLVSMCFEMDGGFHVTLDGVSDHQIAARNVDTIRAGIDWHIDDDRRIQNEDSALSITDPR